MIKISRVCAYQSFDQIDFKVMEDEVYLCFHSDQRGGREQTEQFFADEKHILLVIYWDREKVHEVSFENRAGLSEVGKERLAAVREEAQQKQEVKEMTKDNVGSTNTGEKESMRGLAYDLDSTLSGLELLSSDFKNLDVELGRIAEDVENTPPGDVNLLALQMVNMAHSISLLSSHMRYVTKDLKVEVKKLSGISEEIFDIAVRESKGE